MPIPKPSKNQGKTAFLAQCMSDPIMIKEFPDSKQRAGVCYSQWRNKKAKASIVLEDDKGEEYIFNI